MKLKYSTIPPSEGGNALPDVGTIHISEIEGTLTALSDDLEWYDNLNEYIVGSAGKTDYSGDIDVVIDRHRYTASDKEQFYRDLVELVGEENVARHGAMFHIKYPIKDYNPYYADSHPRTGYVQIDFTFGDYKWKSFYYYSHKGSEYKGAHRNLAISAITASLIKPSTELDSFGRPVRSVRYKWGQNGLIKVCRTSTQKANGTWHKGQTDEELSEPITDPKEIVQLLFPVIGTPTDLDSLESIIAAVKGSYETTLQNKVFATMAKNFSQWTDGQYFAYPEEIANYFETF